MSAFNVEVTACLRLAPSPCSQHRRVALDPLLLGYSRSSLFGGAVLVFFQSLGCQRTGPSSDMLLRGQSSRFHPRTPHASSERALGPGLEWAKAI
nr:hypothetical protein CFP56_00113 [Quercus suber]